MTHSLKINAAQISHIGPKTTNDDAVGVHLPQGHGLSSHTVAAAIADGLSSAEGGRIAAETSVTNFLSDFFCHACELVSKNRRLKGASCS